MAIMTLSATIGVGALLSVRADAKVDAAAESFLTEIREAQNNAIAIKGTETRAWVVQIPQNPTNFTLESFYIRTGGLLLNNKIENTFPISVDTLKIERGQMSGGVYNYSSIPSNTSVYVAFTTPFGTPYVYAVDPNYRGCVSSTAPCGWQESERPSNEWELIMNDTASTFSLSQTHNTDQIIKVTFGGKNKVRSVFINTGGDAYIE
jgi:type II secretory pathway pseudopilin PulG